MKVLVFDMNYYAEVKISKNKQTMYVYIYSFIYYIYIFIRSNPGFLHNAKIF